MPEPGNTNIDVAQHLSRHEVPTESRAHEILEIIEALILAMVAIATAWSGYQAALWDGRQAELYGEASKLRVQADTAATTAEQERSYNAVTVAEWLNAETRGEKTLAAVLERRFLPEYRPAFEAWKHTDPLHNLRAPAGPQSMPEYRNAHADDAARLNTEASAAFDSGTGARHYADDYVRVSVVLATVLLLTAISQRFKMHRIRVGLVITSAILVVLNMYRIIALPRI